MAHQNSMALVERPQCKQDRHHRRHHQERSRLMMEEEEVSVMTIVMTMTMMMMMASSLSRDVQSEAHVCLLGPLGEIKMASIEWMMI